jgi:hypothetical protein
MTSPTKNGRTRREYELLAKAQAGELQRFNADQMAECKPLFDQGLIRVINVRDIYITRTGVDVLKRAGWDKHRAREFFEVFPDDLPPLEDAK